MSRSATSHHRIRFADPNADDESDWHDDDQRRTHQMDDGDDTSDDDYDHADEEEVEEPIELEDFSCIGGFEQTVTQLQRILKGPLLAPSASPRVGAQPEETQGEEDADRKEMISVMEHGGFLLRLHQWFDPENVRERLHHVPSVVTSCASDGDGSNAEAPLVDGDRRGVAQVLDATKQQYSVHIVMSPESPAAEASWKVEVFTSEAAVKKHRSFLAWSFPLLRCVTAIASVTPQEHDALRYFDEFQALSAASTAVEEVRSQASKSQQSMRGALAVFVPSAPPSQQQQQPQHHLLRQHHNDDATPHVLWRGRMVSHTTPPSPPSPPSSKRGAASPRDPVVSCQRFVAEWMPRCPSNLRYLGDVIDLMNTHVGLKCRYVPLRVEASGEAAGCNTTNKKNDSSRSDAPRSSSSSRGGSLLHGRSTTHWCEVEHKYCLRPSQRRCDWEDLMEMLWNRVVASQTTEEGKEGEEQANAQSSSTGKSVVGATTMSSRRSTLSSLGTNSVGCSSPFAFGLTPGTSGNPIQKVDLLIAWPWVDAAHVTDSSIKSTWTILHRTGSSNNMRSSAAAAAAAAAAASGDPNLVFSPAAVVLSATRRNRFEFSRRAASTVGEVAYAVACHFDRIADDASAAEMAELHKRHSSNRRVTPIELAELAMSVFGESPPPAYRCASSSSMWLADPDWISHMFPSPSSTASSSSSTRRRFSSSLPYFGSVRHLFNRFAVACTQLEDPDDIHSLWIAVIDKLRTCIDLDVGGRGRWKYHVDPGCRGGARKEEDVVPSTRVLRYHQDQSNNVGTTTTTSLHHFVTMDMDAPLVMQKLQLLWSSAEEHQHEHDGLAESRRSNAMNDSRDDEPGGDGSAVAQLHQPGWDDDDEGLFDCNSEEDEDTTGKPPVGVEYKSADKEGEEVQQASQVTQQQGDSTMSSEHPRAPPQSSPPRVLPSASAAQCLLLHPDREVVKPPIITMPLTTRDNAEAQERDMVRLGAGKRGASARAWLQSQYLIHEMSMFKFINGNCCSSNSPYRRRRAAPPGEDATGNVVVVTFADFVRWHSPKDFVSSSGGGGGGPSSSTAEEERETLRAQCLQGVISEQTFCDCFLSERMRSSSSRESDATRRRRGGGGGTTSEEAPQDEDQDAEEECHLWWYLWQAAIPRSPGEIQRAARTTHEATAVTLDWLENNYTQEELLMDVLDANIANAMHSIMTVYRVGAWSGGDGRREVLEVMQQRVAQIDRLIHRQERPGSTLCSSSSDDGSVGGWSKRHAEDLRASIKAIVAVLEAMEDDACAVLALRHLLEPNHIARGGQCEEVQEGTAAQTTVGQIVEAAVAVVGGTSSSSSSLPSPVPTVVPVSVERIWNTRMQPSLASRFGCSIDTSSASSDASMATAPAIANDTSNDTLELQCVQAHVQCIAERPMDTAPLPQSMSVLWDWIGGVHDAVAGRGGAAAGEDESGVQGVHPEPGIRGLHTWPPLSNSSGGSGSTTFSRQRGRPAVVVRSSLAEEVL